MMTLRSRRGPTLLTAAALAACAVLTAAAGPAPTEPAAAEPAVKTAAKAADQRGRHWAYVKPSRPALPAVRQADWPRNPIDYFVLARLEREGLAPSPPADRARLIRRVSLDLIGLPPTSTEVAAFVNDTEADAYEKVVDRLLASPRYGERWARPWLDLARYADSNGFQADQLRDSWAYRDWVIDAFNADMPFDRFTIEQIAGDLLPNATLDGRIATGFHRTVTCNVEAGVDPEENRTNQVIDRVNTTATVWLGTTLGCAQCHDHKYDPFTQQDYYQLFAYFNNTPVEVKLGSGVQFDFWGPTMALPQPEPERARREALQKRHDALSVKLQNHITALRSRQPSWEQSIRDAAAHQPQWHTLAIDSFASSGGASHELLDDGSVLVSGKKPDKDVYTIVAHTDARHISGFRLETLTHPSLPGKGPGRHDAKQPNFVLYEFKVAAAPRGRSDAARPVELHAASADFSQSNWHVKGAIDGDAATGWGINPRFGKPHHATFLTKTPLGDDGGTTFTFTLDQHYGGGRTIGRLRLAVVTGDPAATTVSPDIAAIIAVAADKRTDAQRDKLQTWHIDHDAEVGAMRDELAKLKRQIDAIKPDTTLVMVEMGKPRDTFVFKRGNFMDHGPAVHAATPAALPPMPAGAPANRLGLARWLVSPDNPLVGRVTVNRWWMHMFGRGIVATPEDFGAQGEPPTHRQLLDWLAVEFVDGGWSMKHVHKLMVMSATYRQSSRVTAEDLARDPQNRLLSRAPRFRLPAEAIRDNALAISGLLSTKMHGPPVFPYQPPGLWKQVGRNEPKYAVSPGEDRYRRGVYVVWRRAAPYPSFVNFDAPDRGACVVDRPRTNTPLQALTLMNDPAYIEAALATAARIVRDRPQADTAGRVAYAFCLALSRPPTPAEQRHLVQVHERELSRFKANPDAAKALVESIDGWRPPTGLDTTDLAAWFYVANILLNLDETITKG